MMKVLAGDWRVDGVVVLRVTYWLRKPRFLAMPGKFPYERVDVDRIASVEHVTDENKASIMGKAAWGAAGALLLGPVGLLAGALGGGNRQRRVASVTFTDGRKVLLDCPPDDFKAMLSIGYGRRQ